MTSYQDSLPFQLVLDRITSALNTLFNAHNNLDLFEILQNFFAKILNLFEFWRAENTKKGVSPKPSIQQCFVLNLVDLLQWTLHTQRGGLKRHLNFMLQYSQMEFYIMN